MAKTGILLTSNVFDCSPAIIMAGFFCAFLLFVIDYCDYLWHNIDTAKCADYVILQIYVQICEQDCVRV